MRFVTVYTSQLFLQLTHYFDLESFWAINVVEFHNIFSLLFVFNILWPFSFNPLQVMKHDLGIPLRKYLCVI